MNLHVNHQALDFKQTSLFDHFKSKTISLCLFVVVLANCAAASNLMKASVANHSVGIFEDGKFVVVLEHGNRKVNRNAYITVFERCDMGKSFRKLHEQELLNQSTPISFCLCYGGRFLITTEEWYFDHVDGESRNELVIYDLVRHEHTAYRLRDFLPADKIE